MKKILSMVLAILMALSVFSGISVSAFAYDSEIKDFEVNLTRPLIAREEIDGMYEEEKDGRYYFYYYTHFSDGDEIIVTMNDDSQKVYKCHKEDDSLFENFYDENGKSLSFSVFDDQYENHWDVGSHCVSIVIGDVDKDVPVEVVGKEEADLSDVPVVIDKIYIYEHTEGEWIEPYDGTPYFWYDFVEAFNNDGVVTLNNEDGTSSVYTYRLVQKDNGYYGYAFADDDGNVLNFSYFSDSHKGERTAGLYVVTCYISKNGKPLDGPFYIPFEILKGSEDLCWHSSNWVLKNGLYTNKCIGCGKMTTIPFTDIAGYGRYADYLAYSSVYNDFFKGTNPPYNNVFSPTRAVDRAMMVTNLYRMAGEPYSDGENPFEETPFTDVTDTDAYYYDAACWALENGITTESTFKPLNVVTREQTATLMFRFAELYGLVDNDDYKYLTELKQYPDASSISPWAIDAMKWAYCNGMITGTQQGYANPQGETQRIHASKIFFGFGYTCGIGNYD